MVVEETCAHSFNALQMKSARKSGTTTAGKRLLSDDDMIVLWLVKMRHNTPYQALELYFGVSKDTALNYFWEVRSAFHKDVVDLLFFFPTEGEVRANTPSEFAASYPNVRFIVDGLPLKTKLPENFALNRLAWSSYKHYPCFLFVVGESPAAPSCWTMCCRGRSRTDNKVVRDFAGHAVVFSILCLWRPLCGSFDHPEW